MDSIKPQIAIRFENLTRKYGDFTAVDSINLDIPMGSFFGFLGPNGAGKSTTINMLIGLLKPTRGKIYVNGLDVVKNPIEVKRIMGVVPEDLNLYERLKGREYLEFSGILYGLSRGESEERTDELIRLLDINGDKYIADYSQGLKKKISLCAALIHKPQILVLDEPFISVDAISAKKVKDILLDMIATDVTILMTSHILEVIEKLCTDVAIIHQGKILLSGKIDDILRDTESDHRKTLEDIFVKAVGSGDEKGELSWIK